MFLLSYLLFVVYGTSCFAPCKENTVPQFFCIKNTVRSNLHLIIFTKIIGINIYVTYFIYFPLKDTVFALINTY